jgi:hypothetical protein
VRVLCASEHCLVSVPAVLSRAQSCSVVKTSVPTTMPVVSDRNDTLRMWSHICLVNLSDECDSVCVILFAFRCHLSRCQLAAE